MRTGDGDSTSGIAGPTGASLRCASLKPISRLALGRPTGVLAAMMLLLAPDGKATTGTIQDVQHVVILLQENRSFDHYFGSRKGVRGFDDANALLFPNGHTDFYQPYNSGYVLPFPISIQCQTDVDHSEGSGLVGWDSGKWDRWISAKGPPTMAYYTRADLAFYYALADAYTVCDEYHCSFLGPTYPNRLFLMTGTIDPSGSAGGPALDNSLPGGGYRWTTYPERLQAAGVNWRVYQQGSDYFPLNALGWFAQYINAPAGSPLRTRGTTLVPNLVTAFRSDVTNGTLPTVSWLIPPWSLSEHPSFPPANGQALVKQLLDALASNPDVCNSTVFILTYDEDGGFFDHVPSPVPAPGTANEFVNGQPLGLGVRVPAILVSPWTRGGYVCSQIFDHTSVIRFLEQVTGVPEPNISAWRRQVCGDLTSAFDFSNPDTNYAVLPPIATVTCTNIVTPTVPTPQVFPVQEAGTNLARPRPYRPNAVSFADCPNQRVGITMTNAGTASAHFFIYANGYRIDGPWQYDVPPTNSVTDYFSVAGTGGRYDFTCYGPHRFHHRFAGDNSANCNLLNVAVSPNPDDGSITLSLQNASIVPVTFSITNALRPDGRSTYTVQPGYLVTNTFAGAIDSNGRYSLTASADSDASFLRQFVGDTDTTALQFATNAPPVVTNAPTLLVPPGGDLGCNPPLALIPTDASVLAQVAVTDNCCLLATNVCHSDTAVGCTISRTFTVTALDCCTNSVTNQVLYSWTVDTNPPTLLVPTGGDLGCNPPLALIPSDASVLAQVAVTDDCCVLATNVCHSDTAVGCKTNRTFTVTAVDCCANSVTNQVLYSWTVDTNPPTLLVPAGGDLGYNPPLALIPSDASVLAQVAVTDNCCVLTTNVYHSDTTVGCKTNRTFTITAQDCCSNSVTNEVLYSWTVGTNPPPAALFLSASASGGNLTISFPVWASTNALQAATDLASGAWGVIPADITTNGNNAAVIIPITNAVMYFRLQP